MAEGLSVEEFANKLEGQLDKTVDELREGDQKKLEEAIKEPTGNARCDQGETDSTEPVRKPRAVSFEKKIADIISPPRLSMDAQTQSTGTAAPVTAPTPASLPAAAPGAAAPSPSPSPSPAAQAQASGAAPAQNDDDASKSDDDDSAIKVGKLSYEGAEKRYAIVPDTSPSCIRELLEYWDLPIPDFIVEMNSTARRKGKFITDENAPFMLQDIFYGKEDDTRPDKMPFSLTRKSEPQKWVKRLIDDYEDLPSLPESKQAQRTEELLQIVTGSPQSNESLVDSDIESQRHGTGMIKPEDLDWMNSFVRRKIVYALSGIVSAADMMGGFILCHGRPSANERLIEAAIDLTGSDPTTLVVDEWERKEYNVPSLWEKMLSKAVKMNKVEKGKENIVFLVKPDEQVKNEENTVVLKNDDKTNDESEDDQSPARVASLSRKTTISWPSLRDDDSLYWEEDKEDQEIQGKMPWIRATHFIFSRNYRDFNADLLGRSGYICVNGGLRHADPKETGYIIRKSVTKIIPCLLFSNTGEETHSYARLIDEIIQRDEKKQRGITKTEKEKSKPIPLAVRQTTSMWDYICCCCRCSGIYSPFVGNAEWIEVHNVATSYEEAKQKNSDLNEDQLSMLFRSKGREVKKDGTTYLEIRYKDQIYRKKKVDVYKMQQPPSQQTAPPIPTKKVPGKASVNDPAAEESKGDEMEIQPTLTEAPSAERGKVVGSDGKKNAAQEHSPETVQVFDIVTSLAETYDSVLDAELESSDLKENQLRKLFETERTAVEKNGIIYCETEHKGKLFRKVLRTKKQRLLALFVGAPKRIEVYDFARREAPVATYDSVLDAEWKCPELSLLGKNSLRKLFKRKKAVVVKNGVAYWETEHGGKIFRMAWRTRRNSQAPNHSSALQEAENSRTTQAETGSDDGKEVPYYDRLKMELRQDVWNLRKHANLGCHEQTSRVSDDDVLQIVDLYTSNPRLFRNVVVPCDPLNESRDSIAKKLMLSFERSKLEKREIGAGDADKNAIEHAWRLHHQLNKSRRLKGSCRSILYALYIIAGLATTIVSVAAYTNWEAGTGFPEEEFLQSFNFSDVTEFETWRNDTWAKYLLASDKLKSATEGLGDREEWVQWLVLGLAVLVSVSAGVLNLTAADQQLMKIQHAQAKLISELFRFRMRVGKYSLDARERDEADKTSKTSPGFKSRNDAKLTDTLRTNEESQRSTNESTAMMNARKRFSDAMKDIFSELTSLDLYYDRLAQGDMDKADRRELERHVADTLRLDDLDTQNEREMVVSGIMTSFDYHRLRLLPTLKLVERKEDDLRRKTRFLQIFSMLASSAAVVLSAAGIIEIIPAIIAVATTFSQYLKVYDYERRFEISSGAAREFGSLDAYWESLSTLSHHGRSQASHLVITCEQLALQFETMSVIQVDKAEIGMEEKEPPKDSAWQSQFRS